MPDDMDFVQAINEQFIDDCLAEHRRKTSEVSKTSEVCIDCGDEIPVKRRQAVAGCTRCIECQTLLEQWRPL